MWRVTLVVIVVAAAGCGRHLNPEWCGAPGHRDPACAALLDAGSAVCTLDRDCPGSICLPEGSCAGQGSVLYVAQDGTGTACSQDARCLLATAIGEALPARSIISLAPGRYPGAVTIDHAVQIVGAGATLTATTGDVVSVTNSVAADLYLVTIMGTGAASGVTCTSGAMLGVHGVTITGNQQGVTSACDLTLERSTVSSNTDGALAITAGSIAIHDNFLVTNGSDTARAASVSIAAGVTGSFDFNTVAYNNTRQSANTGVDCNAKVTGVGNLVTDNMHKGAFDMKPQVSATCAFTQSYTLPGAGGNDLQWVDVTAAAADFHLTAGSTAVLDKVSCAARLDVDGDLRPTGAACDYGADELEP